MSGDWVRNVWLLKRLDLLCRLNPWQSKVDNRKLDHKNLGLNRWECSAAWLNIGFQTGKCRVSLSCVRAAEKAAIETQHQIRFL